MTLIARNSFASLTTPNDQNGIRFVDLPRQGGKGFREIHAVGEQHHGRHRGGIRGRDR